MKSPKMLAAAASALALSFATAAGAATTLDLTVGNTDISPYPAPYGSLLIDLIDAVTANLTFTAGAEGQYDYFFIGTGAADVNVNATSWTVSNLVTSGPGTIANDGAKNISSFGVFNQTFKQSDGYGDRAKTISFTLKDTSGTWASSADVLLANSAGKFAAAHIAVCDTKTNPTCASDPGAVKTGFAADGPGVIHHGVPEPATWGLMILGFGLAGATLRRRQAATAS